MPPDPTADELLPTTRDLLAALGHEVGDDEDPADAVEEYVLEYLDEDLGMNLFVTLDAYDGKESLHLRAKLSFYTADAVEMWSPDFPLTVGQFHSYLDELDVRVARLRAIVELPVSDEELEDEDQLSVVEALSRLFGTDERSFIHELGEDWTPVDSEVMGSASIPVRYLLWQDRLIVGLDDEYGHLFTPIFRNGKAEVGDVMSYFDLGDKETIGLTEFAQVVRAAVEAQ